MSKETGVVSLNYTHVHVHVLASVILFVHFPFRLEEGQMIFGYNCVKNGICPVHDDFLFCIYGLCLAL